MIGSVSVRMAASITNLWRKAGNALLTKQRQLDGNSQIVDKDKPALRVQKS